MKKVFFSILMLVGTLSMNAQNQTENEKRQKFDPAKFEAQLEEFITKQVELSQQEATAFFPLYREMRNKQRTYFEEMRKFRHVDTDDEKKCREAIEKMDKNDLEMREIQKDYHAKFLKVLPASKVLKVIKAEEKYHRKAFQRTVKPGNRKQVKQLARGKQYRQGTHKHDGHKHDGHKHGGHK